MYLLARVCTHYATVMDAVATAAAAQAHILPMTPLLEFVLPMCATRSITP